MFFELFSPGKVDAFAQALGSEVCRRYPPAVANDPERTISNKRRTAILEEIFSGAQRFSLENHLGMFRKARLGSSFRWALREMGYDEEFIDRAARLLLASLAPRGDEPGLSHAGKPRAIE
jgi:hypothetical protein